MQRILWRISTLMLGLMLVCAGTIWAQREAPDERGERAAEQQEMEETREDYGPMMHHMRGMMQHMRGMMHGMEGMMGPHARMMDDDDDDDMPGGGMMGRGMMGYHGRGYGYRMMRHAERLMDELDLSEQQEEQIRGLVRDHMKQAIQTRAELATQRVDLMAALDAENVDMAKVKSLLQQMAARRADLRFAHLSLMQAIKQQLTPEQLEKFNARWGHRMMGYGHKGRGDWKAHSRRQRYGREEGRGMGPGMGRGRGMGMGSGGMREAPEKER